MAFFILSTLNWVNKTTNKNEIIKIMCNSVNHTHFPKEDHLPDWERPDNKVTKGDRVDYAFMQMSEGPKSRGSCQKL